MFGQLPSLAKWDNLDTVSVSVLLLEPNRTKDVINQCHKPSLPTISVKSFGLYFSIHGMCFSAFCGAGLSSTDVMAMNLNRMSCKLSKKKKYKTFDQKLKFTSPEVTEIH